MREVWFHKDTTHNKRVYYADEYYYLESKDALLLVSSGCACYADDSQSDLGDLEHDDSRPLSRTR